MRRYLHIISILLIAAISTTGVLQACIGEPVVEVFEDECDSSEDESVIEIDDIIALTHGVHIFLTGIQNDTNQLSAQIQLTSQQIHLSIPSPPPEPMV